jgi:hypothetical protein
MTTPNAATIMRRFRKDTPVGEIRSTHWTRTSVGLAWIAAINTVDRRHFQGFGNTESAAMQAAMKEARRG